MILKIVTRGLLIDGASDGSECQKKLKTILGEFFYKCEGIDSTLLHGESIVKADQSSPKSSCGEITRESDWAVFRGHHFEYVT